MFIVHHANVLVRQDLWPVDGALRDSAGFELDRQEGDFELHHLVITGNSIENHLAITDAFVQG